MTRRRCPTTDGALAAGGGRAGARARPSAPTRSCSGPGSGATDGAVAFARELRARRSTLPLRARRRRPQRARRRASRRSRARAAPTVLTPHAGELGRLLERRLATRSSARRLRHAREAARRAGAIVVLKGDDTLVADARRARRRQPAAARPALATAGTGDVLSGVIGALLAKRHASRSRRPAPASALHAARRAGARPRATAPDGVIASRRDRRAARRARR